MKISIAVLFVAFLSFSGLFCSAAPVAATSQPAQLTILRPDGKPAAGAFVVVLPLQHPENSYIFQGDFNPAPDPGIEQLRSDAQGSLAVGNLRKDQWIAIFDPSGYLEPDRNAIGQRTLTLLPWGRIEGKLIRQRADVAGQTVRGCCSHSKGKGRIIFLQEAKTDAGGRFVLDRLPPGEGYVCRLTSQSGPVQYKSIELSPGKTTTVAVGGAGRTVTGRIEVPVWIIGGRKWQSFGEIHTYEEYPVPPMPDDVKNGTAEKREEWMAAFLKTDAAKAYTAASNKIQANNRRYTMEIELDGTFRVEDVLPGEYESDVQLFPSPRGPGSDTGDDRLARGHTKFTVPAVSKNANDTPLQVPAVPMLDVYLVAVGKPAPAFSAPTLDGKILKLSDFKGRYVLMDFWSTWCGPCIEEMPNIRSVYDAYGKDGRLQMISLTLDEKPEVAKKFVDKNQIAWNQVWVGDDAGKRIVESYILDGGIPQILLIGPDGKVIANNLRGPEIKSAVAKVMNSK